MRLGSLELIFHRTVRVADGRTSSNLPPSLGAMELHRVSKYKNCPKNWEKEGFFMSLHDTEAMWMSFRSPDPVSLLIGCGGINALTGEKLGTTLVKDNYLTVPPQPWLDGWKDKDGTVYQFVATAYQKGEGITVAEQLIGKESKTGAIGIALFDALDRSKLKAKHIPHEGWSSSSFGSDFNYPVGANLSYNVQTSPTSSGLLKSANPATHYNGIKGQSVNLVSKKSFVSQDCVEETSLGMFDDSAPRSILKSTKFAEMGIGKGGKIIQKIYEDPYGLDVWKEKPTTTLAVYLVNAEMFAEITGIPTPVPVGHETYDGHWFGLNDKQEKDVAGSDKFTGLKSAVFPGSDLGKEKSPKKEPKKDKKEAVVTK
jgi:hypothetical protein